MGPDFQRKTASSHQLMMSNEMTVITKAKSKRTTLNDNNIFVKQEPKPLFEDGRRESNIISVFMFFPFPFLTSGRQSDTLP
jgi:hypothetical protein